MITSGKGEALVELNGQRYTLKGEIPETYADMRVIIKEITQQELTLDVQWHDEGRDPDAKVTLTKNV